jgi:ubiquitin carboxyl-terminal hydrolase 48
MDDFLSEVAQEMLVSNKKTDITEEDDGCVIITPAAGEGKEIDAILVDDDQKQSGNKLESNCGDLSNLVRMDDETVHEAGENLFLRNWIPAEAFLHDNAFDPDDLDATKDTCIYSKSTREELRAIRKQTLVDCEPICDYVEHILLANADSSVALDDYFARLRGLHDSMLFFNPQKEDSSPSVNKIRMAVPPGIKNLGATCYLNTQIQCLARNTGLLEGIFAWKTPEVRSRMDSVLEKLQQLLARLAYGADSTISTEAFSQALGLQNDEMQDPNEFARLLFDRMHEAFQRCAHHESGNADNNTKSLSTLLPKLFMGVMTYETRCVNCRRVTERNERFMDINLPIVNKCDKPTNKKNEQLKIDEAFAAGERGQDTDVQYCLDSYMCPEDLSGDNMYFCSSCGEKRNASRCVVLNELPPVLNLQLCRYVYDREKQTKKKLSDRVLLSRVLQVRSRLGSTPKVYRLCAVMKHLGSSAYRGHYIAEAMDWQTGVWFEFNDQVVNILNSGPSCSTDDESEAAGFSAKKSEKKKGSQDAYNMYYVSEKFLSKCALNSLGLGVSPLVSSVAKQVETERKSRYDMVRE